MIQNSIQFIFPNLTENHSTRPQLAIPENAVVHAASIKNQADETMVTALLHSLIKAGEASEEPLLLSCDTEWNVATNSQGQIVGGKVGPIKIIQLAFKLGRIILFMDSS